VNLEDLSDLDFRDLVDRELRKDHPQTSPTEKQRLALLSPELRSPEVINRWIMVLEIMKASSETQLGAKLAETKKLHGTIPQAEYLKALRKYQSWKAGNVRFLHSVNARLVEARAIRTRLFGTTYPTRIVDERNKASQALNSLIRAIEMHRTTVLTEYDPSDADEALWDAVPEAA
jgi:hypothetical protein